MKPLTPAEFRRWFAGSVVVDAAGRPRVLYHGTRRVFDQFRPGDDDGIHFGLLEQAHAIGGTLVIPVHLAIRHPLRVEDFGSSTGDWIEAIAAAKAAGHDGLVYANQHEGEGDSWVAFSGEQACSALGRYRHHLAAPASRLAVEEGPSP